ncbi:head-tail connector protein [Rhizobium sp. DKSPLA3]|uniref:Head-tail connector protein n=1 Tax=Rhizobium quercicola TaxID=2901226 RepID=A0A9X1NUT2_9HYPH|nr:head-tail connector protein [Rhizobium quercicola]MCD7109713.1 head-tail connector protein [Rhizobium quercicola]
MALVDIELARKHLRIFHEDEDAEIGVYLAAAESIVLEYIDRPVLPTGQPLPDPDADGFTIIVTPPIVAAVLLVLSDLYERREAPEKDAGEAVLQPTVRRLLAPWRVWRPSLEDETCTYVL